MKTRIKYFKKITHIVVSIAIVIWSISLSFSGFVPTARAGTNSLGNVQIQPGTNAAPFSEETPFGDTLTFTLVPSTSFSSVSTTYLVSDDFSGTSIVNADLNTGGTFTWTPGLSDVGIHDLTFTVSDGTNTGTVAIEVTVDTQPVVSSVSPTKGETTGGTSVIITGTGFTGGTRTVDFGTIPAESFTVNNGTSITAISPAGTLGAVDVTVTTPGGTSATGNDDQFIYTPDTDATLSNLTVNGTAVIGFSPSTLSYSVKLPAGTTVVPTVAATVNDTGKATEVITQAPSLPGAATAVVTAQDGTTNQTYTVNFSFSTTTVPALTITSQPASGTQAPTTYSQYASTNCDGIYCSVPMLEPLNIIAKITLVDSNTYGTLINGITFTFQGIQASSSFISDVYQPFPAPKNIMLFDPAGGVLVGYGRVTGSNQVTFYFPPSWLVDYGLPLSANKPMNLLLLINSSAITAGATVSQMLNVSISSCGYTQLDSNDKSYSYQLSGTPISVASINFPVASDATLSSLTVDNGTLTPAFSATQTSYTDALPSGATAVPSVTAMTNDPSATTTITSAASLQGTTTVLVTAADGITQQTYTVNFTVAPSDLSALTEEIGVASTTVTDAVVGDAPGQYTQASVDALNAAIAIAQAVTNTEAQSVVDAAVTTLTGTVGAFQPNSIPLTIGTNPDGSLSATTTSAITASTTSGGIDIAVNIPMGTVITGTSTWDGTLTLPEATTTFATLTPDSSYTASAVAAIAVGAGDTPLTFDQAARLLFAGQTGKLVGWSRGGVFTQITNVCSADNQTVGDALPTGGDCVFDNGTDLIVWTKHFTTFVVYAQTAIVATSNGGGGGGSSGGGGGGGGSTSTPIPTPTPTNNSTTTQGQVLGTSTINGAHPNGTLILSNGAVYLISNGQLRGFRNPVEYQSYGFDFSSVVPANASDLLLPQGPIMKAMDGTLVLDASDNRTVYVIGDNGTKRGFVSAAVFTQLGYNFNQTVKINLSDYPAGDPITSASNTHPDGTLVLDGKTVWWINAGERYGFSTEDVFNSYGWTFAKVLKANQADLNLHQGSVLVPRSQAMATGQWLD